VAKPGIATRLTNRTDAHEGRHYDEG
jgi:hypothetical protein